MQDDDCARIIRDLLAEHTKSPSLRHVRDPYALNKLTNEIVKRLGRRSAVWRKWEGARETLLKSAALCWIPSEDLREYLNEMSGPPLTITDVAQRLRAFHEEPFEPYPNEALRAGCMEFYEREKAAGTELPAIIGALQEHVEREEETMRNERAEEWRRRLEEERVALEQRFLAGADCKWTPIQRSKELYCRMNGRAYRLAPSADKMWNLHRIKSAEDTGVLLGRYKRRAEVTKALVQLAFSPEPRW